MAQYKIIIKKAINSISKNILKSYGIFYTMQYVSCNIITNHNQYHVTFYNVCDWDRYQQEQISKVSNYLEQSV